MIFELKAFYHHSKPSLQGPAQQTAIPLVRKVPNAV